MIGLTPRAAELFDFIQDKAKNGHVMPTFVEMGAAIGLSSKSGVARLMDQLVLRGYVRTVPRKARAIELVTQRCPACGSPIHSEAA